MIRLLIDYVAYFSIFLIVNRFLEKKLAGIIVTSQMRHWVQRLNVLVNPQRAPKLEGLVKWVH